MREYRFKVAAQEQGMRLLAFLREKLANALSVKGIKRAIESGQCSINGKIEPFSSAVLARNDQILFYLPQDSEKLQNTQLNILFEDEDLLICDKPSGVISENAVFNRLLPQYEGRLELVHRLDKETSGAILAAKNPRMREALEKLFAKRQVKKVYRALVIGTPVQPQGVIRNFLAKKRSYQGQSIWGSVPREKGVLAITRWKCLKKGKSMALLECEPETGRTHQIRVHLSEMGYPIVGDKQYGKGTPSSLRANRTLLHAYRLSFIHPQTLKSVAVKAPIPKDFVTY